MSERLRYQSLLAVVDTILIMFITACVLAYSNKSVEAIGIGSAMVGLIGIDGSLVGSKGTTETVKIDQPANKPVPVEEK